MSTHRAGSPNQPTQTIGLSDVLRFLRRGALFAVSLTVVTLATTYVFTRHIVPVYRASAALVASLPGSGYGSLGLLTPAPVDPGVYQTVLREGDIVPRMLTALRGRAPSAAEVRAFERTVHVSVQKLDLSSVITISVEATNPAFAASAANALAGDLVTWDRDRAEQAVAGSIGALEQAIAAIDAELAGNGTGNATGNATAPSAARRQALTRLRQERVQQLTNARAIGESSVAVGLLQPLGAATVPRIPTGPGLAFRLTAAALLALVIAYGLALLRSALDPRLRSRADLLALTGTALLAEFPIQTGRSGSLLREAADLLRSSLPPAAHTPGPVTLLVSSPRAGREQAGVAARLAESLALAGHRTLLVDADLRQPNQRLGAPASGGDTVPLETQLESPDLAYPPSSVAVSPHVVYDVVPSGTGSPHAVALLSRGFGRLLERWRETYGFIVVDGPPVLPFADALTIAPLCTGVILCASLARSVRADVQESGELLRHIGVRVLGSVLTEAPAARPARAQVEPPHTGPSGTGPSRPGPPRTEPAAREPVEPPAPLGQPGTMRNVRVRDR